MIIQRWLRCVIIIVITLIVMPFLTFLGPHRLSEFCFKELCYRIVADKVANNLIFEEQKVLSLCDWVHKNVVPRDFAGACIDIDPCNDMIRGIGWCDQQSNTLITLARKQGMLGQLIFLRGYTPVSTHSVCAIFLDGKFRIFDPYFNAVYRHKETQEIATFQQLQDDFDAYIEPKLIKEQEPGQHKRLYGKEYPPDHFLTNTQSGVRKALTFMMECYCKVFGRLFSRTYIGIYLKLLTAKDIEGRGIESVELYRTKVNNLLKGVEK